MWLQKGERDKTRQARLTLMTDRRTGDGQVGANAYGGVDTEHGGVGEGDCRLRFWQTEALSWAPQPMSSLFIT